MSTSAQYTQAKKAFKNFINTSDFCTESNTAKNALSHVEIEGFMKSTDYNKAKAKRIGLALAKENLGFSIHNYSGKSKKWKNYEGEYYFYNCKRSKEIIEMTK